ncbi:MAG: hypothetical protein MJ246_07590 [Clostridia bacterium]|nr:hypothetical protein [Clostridia bacterium]
MFKLNSNKPDKKVKAALIGYFALTGATGLIRMIVSFFEIAIPGIYTKIMKLIVSPYEGLSFVLRFDNVGNIFAILFAFVFIILIFNLTSEDDLYEFRKLQEAEEEEEKENKD